MGTKKHGLKIKYKIIENKISKHWCLNDKLHREYGPAVENVSGDKKWYLNGIEYIEEEYWKQLKCKYCGGKYRSMKAISEIIHYCPRCQR